MTAEDQVCVTGLLEGGAALSIHYRGGHSRGTNLLWEINGTAGDLQLTAAGGHAQIFEMTVRGGKGAEASHSWVGSWVSSSIRGRDAGAWSRHDHADDAGHRAQVRRFVGCQLEHEVRRKPLAELVFFDERVQSPAADITCKGPGF
jgi:hypothetical protein